MTIQKVWFADVKGDPLLARSIVAAEIEINYPDSFDAAAIQKLVNEYGGMRTHNDVSVAPSDLNSNAAGPLTHKTVSCRFPCPSPQALDDLLRRLQRLLESSPPGPDRPSVQEYEIRAKLVAECQGNIKEAVGSELSAPGTNEAPKAVLPPPWMSGRSFP